MKKKKRRTRTGLEGRRGTRGTALRGRMEIVKEGKCMHASDSPAVHKTRSPTRKRRYIEIPFFSLVISYRYV